MKRQTQKETIKSNDDFIFLEEKDNKNYIIKSLKHTIPILALSIRIYLNVFINRPKCAFNQD